MLSVLPKYNKIFLKIKRDERSIPGPADSGVIRACGWGTFAHQAHRTEWGSCHRRGKPDRLQVLCQTWAEGPFSHWAAHQGPQVWVQTLLLL